MPEIMIGQLLDAEFRQSQFGRLFNTLRGSHIHEMQRRLASPGVIFGKHVAESSRRTTRSDAGLRGIDFRYGHNQSFHSQSVTVR